MYSLSIIGGGAIACGYDTPSTNAILTHIHAGLTNQNIDLKSLVEINKQNHASIQNKWGSQFNIFDTIEKSLQYCLADIIIIATPTQTHLQIIEQILAIYNPKLILCEKPLVSNQNEYIKINGLFENSPTMLLTNFPRRFDPSINKLKNFIQKTVSKIYHFNGIFPKGLLHNGSHMIDLICMLIGKIEKLESIHHKQINHDLYGCFSIATNSSSGIITNINNDTLSLFELTIYTDTAKIEISGPNQEISIHHVCKSNTFKQYNSFGRTEKLENTLNQSAYNSLQYAIEILNNQYKYSQIQAEQKEVNDIIYDKFHMMSGEKCQN